MQVTTGVGLLKLKQSIVHPPGSQVLNKERMPSNTVLISGPAVKAAQILIWPYSCVFLSPMSTAIRTNVCSFEGALNDLLYIP